MRHYYHLSDDDLQTTNSSLPCASDPKNCAIKVPILRKCKKIQVPEIAYNSFVEFWISASCDGAGWLWKIFSCHGPSRTSKLLRVHRQTTCYIVVHAHGDTGGLPCRSSGSAHIPLRSTSRTKHRILNMFLHIHYLSFPSDWIRRFPESLAKLSPSEILVRNRFSLCFAAHRGSDA